MIQYPTTIGRYKVLGELGRGSMGIVYLAEDPALKREVAIKLVHRGTIAQEDVLARFRQEAEISARLNHPNVIMVFDVGEEQDFGPFMAMEFADGEVLSDVLARAPMAQESAALILIQGFHAARPIPWASSTGISSLRTSSSPGTGG
jgi:serine/threonine protein kinase